MDDDPGLVAAAIAQGYRGGAIRRAGGRHDVPWVATLHDVVELVDGVCEVGPCP